MRKVCNRCGEEKDLDEFYPRYNICKLCKRNDASKYYKTNLESIKAIRKTRDKVYRENNKPLEAERHKIYRENNIEKIKLSNKRYREENKELVKASKRRYKDTQLKTNHIYRMKHNVANLIRHALRQKQFMKSSTTIDILGCDFEIFQKHIESKFESWMTWENYGKYNGKPEYGWDIDHITPHSIAITEEDVIKLNHYTNLQPLCSYYNRDIKKDRY